MTLMTFKVYCKKRKQLGTLIGRMQIRKTFTLRIPAIIRDEILILFLDFKCE